jgi:putative sterol carrier protein
VTAGRSDADIEVVQDYDTAAAISKGDLAPAAAFAAGRLKLGGGVGQLVRHGDVTAGLADLFGSLRASTSY